MTDENQLWDRPFSTQTEMAAALENGTKQYCVLRGNWGHNLDEAQDPEFIFALVFPSIWNLPHEPTRDYSFCVMGNDTPYTLHVSPEQPGPPLDHIFIGVIYLYVPVPCKSAYED